MNPFGGRTEPFGGPTYSPTIAWDSGLPSSPIRFNTLHPIIASSFCDSYRDSRCQPRARRLFPSVRLYLKKRFSTAVPDVDTVTPAASLGARLCESSRGSRSAAPDSVVWSGAFRSSSINRNNGAVGRYRPSSRWDHDLDVRGADLTEQLVHRASIVGPIGC